MLDDASSAPATAVCQSAPMLPAAVPAVSRPGVQCHPGGHEKVCGRLRVRTD